jgi:Domain of unknown function (DUF4266)
MIASTILLRIEMHTLIRLLTLLAALATAGCATMEPPKPWEKGDLVRPAMQIDPDKLETKIQQHIYASKEAATGGYGVGGGGCGCN